MTSETTRTLPRPKSHARRTRTTPGDAARTRPASWTRKHQKAPETRQDVQGRTGRPETKQDRQTWRPGPGSHQIAQEDAQQIDRTRTSRQQLVPVSVHLCLPGPARTRSRPGPKRSRTPRSSQDAQGRPRTKDRETPVPDTHQGRTCAWWRPGASGRETPGEKQQDRPGEGRTSPGLASCAK